MPTFCGTAMRPSTPISAIASCAPWTALVSSSTQPEFGSLTKRLVAAASRSRSALESFSPSASHSAETASQSMPLPLTTRRGLSARGVRNSRWNAGLPRNSASFGLCRPRLGERAEKIFIRVADPQARLLHEPIQRCAAIASPDRGAGRRGFPVCRPDVFSSRWQPIRCRSRTRRFGRAGFSRAAAAAPCRRAARK